MTVSADALYDEDFYAWTVQQADLLRRLPLTSNSVDAGHVAEEIEDLGRGELRTAQSLVELDKTLTRSIEAKLDLPARYKAALRLVRRLERDVPG
jgi:hypothetical protein